MSQDMAVVLRSNRGATLRELSHDGAQLAQLLANARSASFPYLRFIDEYGITVFSPMQMQALLTDLEQLAQITPEASDLLAELVSIARQCESVTHSQMVFIGD